MPGPYNHPEKGSMTMTAQINFATFYTEILTNNRIPWSVLTAKHLLDQLLEESDELDWFADNIDLRNALLRDIEKWDRKLLMIHINDEIFHCKNQHINLLSIQSFHPRHIRLSTQQWIQPSSRLNLWVRKAIWWHRKCSVQFWACSIEWRTERICEGCSCANALQQYGIIVESLEECVEKAISGMSLFFSWRNVRDETYYCVFGGDYSTEESCVTNANTDVPPHL